MADRAVIFYNVDRWLERDPDPEMFEVRFDAQILPRGSVVCGFILANGGGVIDPPYMATPEIENQFRSVCREALDVLELTDFRLVAGPLNVGGDTLVLTK